MTTAILIQDEKSTILEMVKTEPDHYQLTIPNDEGLVCQGINKIQAEQLRDYLNETLTQQENW